MKTTFGSIKMLQIVFDYYIVSWIISWLLCLKQGGFPVVKMPGFLEAIFKHREPDIADINKCLVILDGSKSYKK